MPALTVMLLLAAPAVQHRFVHSLAGVPVGEVTISRDGELFTYASRHFFRRGESAESVFTSTDSARWASESLLVQPKVPGCYAVEDEVTRVRGEACIARPGAATSGTLFGRPFTATYKDRALVSLTVGDSRFQRHRGPVTFADPFADGLPITGNGNALALVPPLKGTRRAMPTPDGEALDCLSAANTYVAQHLGFEVVLGLLDDGERGWPHAWVQHHDTQEALDPSRPQLAGVTPRYLALPKARAGAVYLDLLTKRRVLKRVASP